MVGLSVFTISIIIALISAAKLPVPPQTWSDQLIVYVLAIIFALLGLWLLRRVAVISTNHSTVTIGSTCISIELLQQLLTEMPNLKRDIEHSDRTAILNRVQILLEQAIIPFTAQQQEIFQQFGRTQGIKIIMIVALGERFLNRIWSAACDGHFKEASHSYLKALAAFEEALILLQPH
jgi:hypothetical protein